MFISWFPMLEGQIKLNNRGPFDTPKQDNYKSFPFSHTQKSLCIYIHPFHFYSFLYTCLEPFMPTHLKYTKAKNDVIYLQSFNDTYINPTLQYYLILTRMSRLWPRKWDCVFYSVTVAYNFDVTVGHCRFCKGHD